MKRTCFVLTIFQFLIYGHAVMSAVIERTGTISKTLRFDGSRVENTVVVDNVFGSIDARGYEGDEVRVTVRKTVVARSEEKAAEAEEEVELKVFEEGEMVELYVDGPFRERNGRGINWRGYEREGYKVVFDFELDIPRECAVELKTIDEGDITVTSVDGDFEVSNVNGAVEMKALRGSGSAYAVNGEVTVQFIGNPTEGCLFGTVNGDVRLNFPRDLCADFYLKTLNGDVYTDFEVTALPARTTTSNSRNGKKIYKIGHATGVRVGRGGPEIEMNTLNGDMFITSR